MVGRCVNFRVGLRYEWYSTTRKRICVGNFSGGPKKSYRAGGYNNYTISELTKPLQQTANLTGMKFLTHFVQYNSVVATEKEISESSKDLVQHIKDPALNPDVALKKY